MSLGIISTGGRDVVACGRAGAAMTSLPDPVYRRNTRREKFGERS